MNASPCPVHISKSTLAARWGSKPSLESVTFALWVKYSFLNDSGQYTKRTPSTVFLYMHMDGCRKLAAVIRRSASVCAH